MTYVVRTSSRRGANSRCFRSRRWAASLEALTADQLDVPGYGAYPLGLDPQIPFIGIIRWTNRELIHHLAEVALLRDLYAADRLVTTKDG